MEIIKTSSMIKELSSVDRFKEYLTALDSDVANLTRLAQGRVRFGSGTDGAKGENIQGEYQEFTSHASANTEFSVTHTLGAIPLGYIIMWQDKAGNLYQGPTTGTNWTSTTISLKSSGTSVKYNIFLIK